MRLVFLLVGISTVAFFLTLGIRSFIDGRKKQQLNKEENNE